MWNNRCFTTAFHNIIKTCGINIHNNGVTWSSWCLKSQATRQLFQQCKTDYRRMAMKCTYVLRSYFLEVLQMHDAMQFYTKYSCFCFISFTSRHSCDTFDIKIDMMNLICFKYSMEYFRWIPTKWSRLNKMYQTPVKRSSWLGYFISP